MGTSEIVPIFAWIVREGGLPVPLHRSPLQDQLGLQGFVYSLWTCVRFAAAQAVHEAVDRGGVDVPGNDLPVLEVERDDDLALPAGVVCDVVAVLAAALAEVGIEIIALLELELVVLGHDAVELFRHHHRAEALRLGVDLPAEGFQIRRAALGGVEIRGVVPLKHAARRPKQQQKDAADQEERQQLLKSGFSGFLCHSLLPSAAPLK